MKIVSLLPSATEIICELGLRDQLVGVTHECDYPISVIGLPQVTQSRIPKDSTSRQIDNLVREQLETDTALYSLRMDVLESLKPDLIVTQALCDVCAVAEKEVLDAACDLPGNPRVVNLEPMTLQDVFDTLMLVGDATNQKVSATNVVKKLQARVDKVQQRTEQLIPLAKHPAVAFLEWIDPPFNAGHWSPHLIELAGGIDCLGNKYQPSQTTPWEKVVAAQPDVLFLALCGFEVERAQQDISILKSYPGYAELPCVKNDRVYLTDGNAFFNRPGPRLADSLEIIAHALHPQVHTLPSHLSAALKV